MKNIWKKPKAIKKRLEEICEELDINPKGEECQAMKGLIKEAEQFLKEVSDDDTKDAGLIADAQRVEHYEIAGYGSVATYAEELGYDDIAKKLKSTLDEEYSADDKLKQLAKSRINQKAK